MRKNVENYHWKEQITQILLITLLVLCFVLNDSAFHPNTFNSDEGTFNNQIDEIPVSCQTWGQHPVFNKKNIPLLQSPSSSLYEAVSHSTSRYSVHSPFSINGNTDLSTQAANQGWPGTGTVEDPIIITGYEIRANPEVSRVLFQIENTNLYFRLSMNSFYGLGKEQGYLAIRFVNVSHSMIENNQVYNCTDGIFLHNSPQNTISNNTIENGKYGIFLNNCTHSTLLDNIVKSSEDSGIALLSSTYNTLSNNIIVSDNSTGITRYGIILQSTVNNTILNNSISNNQYGIIIDQSDNNTISRNSITNHDYRGLCFWSGSSNNQVYQNDFIENSLDESYQAVDGGLNNIFSHNYWNEWKSTSPYQIFGGGYDHHPQAIPFFPNAHYLLRPTITNPQGKETLISNTTIQWTSTKDSWNHSVTYSVYYSIWHHLFRNWTVLGSGLKTTTFSWDTRTVENKNYLVMVIAICTDGITTADISTRFVIENSFATENPFLIPSFDWYTVFLAFCVLLIVISSRKVKAR
ncbi:MAG: nitrous oxide reductase family maturation protein NosD [Candidatus Hodarchaeota archaeon]